MVGESARVPGTQMGAWQQPPALQQQQTPQRQPVGVNEGTGGWSMLQMKQWLEEVQGKLEHNLGRLMREQLRETVREVMQQQVKEMVEGVVARELKSVVDKEVERLVSKRVGEVVGSKVQSAMAANGKQLEELERQAGRVEMVLGELENKRGMLSDEVADLRRQLGGMQRELEERDRYAKKLERELVRVKGNHKEWAQQLQAEMKRQGEVAQAVCVGLGTQMGEEGAADEVEACMREWKLQREEQSVGEVTPQGMEEGWDAQPGQRVEAEQGEVQLVGW